MGKDVESYTSPNFHRNITLKRRRKMKEQESGSEEKENGMENNPTTTINLER